MKIEKAFGPDILVEVYTVSVYEKWQRTAHV